MEFALSDMALPASTAQPVLYWCARNMSFWSSISFNLAVLMNLLVAFFYPFKGVRGGTCGLSFEKKKK